MKNAAPLEMLWLDPKRVARIRTRPPWRSLLDDALGEPGDLGDPVLPDQDVSPADLSDVLLILARGATTDGDGVASALAKDVHEDGKVAPTILLVAGELRLSFAELDVLKATITTATPFAGGDEPLSSAIESGKEFLGIPGLSPAPAVTESVTNRIRDAFGRVKRAVAPGYLEAQVDRALLEQRRYQRRMFRGKPHLRALLQGPTDKGPLLVYLLDAAADKLPLYTRFPARLVVEAHPSVDQFESHPFALEAYALARELPAPRKG